jgi:hypothetical protein
MIRKKAPWRFEVQQEHVLPEVEGQKSFQSFEYPVKIDEIIEAVHSKISRSGSTKVLVVIVSPMYFLDLEYEYAYCRQSTRFLPNNFRTNEARIMTAVGPVRVTSDSCLNRGQIIVVMDE